MGPLFRPAQVSQKGVPSFYYIDCTTQLGVIHKLAENTLDPIVCKEAVERQSQEGTPGGHHSSLASTWMWNHKPQTSGYDHSTSLLSLNSPPFKSIFS